MFCVFLKSGNEFDRHVGTPIPKLTNEEIVYIQADGDELDFILDNFTGIPYIPGKIVQKWFGDHAKFIYHNLMW